MSVTTLPMTPRDRMVVELRAAGPSWSRVAEYAGMSKSGARAVAARAGLDDEVAPLPGAEAMLRGGEEPLPPYFDRLIYGIDYTRDDDTDRVRRRRLWAALVLFYDPESNWLAVLRARRVFGIGVPADEATTWDR